jgi:hypothetical protein
MRDRGGCVLVWFDDKNLIVVVELFTACFAVECSTQQVGRIPMQICTTMRYDV